MNSKGTRSRYSQDEPLEPSKTFTSCQTIYPASISDKGMMNWAPGNKFRLNTAYKSIISFLPSTRISWFANWKIPFVGYIFTRWSRLVSLSCLRPCPQVSEPRTDHRTKNHCWKRWRYLAKVNTEMFELHVHGIVYVPAEFLFNVALKTASRSITKRLMKLNFTARQNFSTSLKTFREFCWTRSHLKEVSFGVSSQF